MRSLAVLGLLAAHGILGGVTGRASLRNSSIGFVTPLLATRDDHAAAAVSSPTSRFSGSRCRQHTSVQGAARLFMKDSSTSSKAWLNEHVNDHWVKEAQKFGYRSRAAFKLLQLQESDKLIKKGNLVLDLGSAPGSWSQVAAKLVGEDGTVISSDILPMKAIKDVTFIQGDFTDDTVRGELSLLLAERGRYNDRADVMLSDMAPNLSGNKVLDQERAFGLVELALAQADDWLKPGGNCAVKVFRGVGYDECLALMRTKFDEVRMRKPAASRGRTNEAFLVGVGFHRPTEEEKELFQLERDAQLASEAAALDAGADAGGGGKKMSKKQRRAMEALGSGLFDDDDYF